MGHCDIIVTGGSEAAVTMAGLGGFNAMHALSTRNESPQSASRPFDGSRDGFVLGEGGWCIDTGRLRTCKSTWCKNICRELLEAVCLVMPIT